MEVLEFKPPYMSFQTFWSFIDELAAKPLPPRIDRSLMASKSGTDQANLTMAFTSFGLTGEDGSVLPRLADLVAMEPDSRRVAFGELVRQHYAVAMRVSDQNGTEADLKKVFTDTWPSIGSAETRRKAITFFLHAARSAEVPLSPHFPTTRTSSGAAGATRARRSPTRRRPQPQLLDAGVVEAPQGRGGEGHSQAVQLRSGGVVTLSYDVSLFELDSADQDFVLDLIGKVKSYMAATPEMGKHSDSHRAGEK